MIVTVYNKIAKKYIDYKQVNNITFLKEGIKLDYPNIILKYSVFDIEIIREVI